MDESRDVTDLEEDVDEFEEMVKYEKRVNLDHFWAGSDGARKYLAKDRGDNLYRTVSAIYASTSLEYHRCVQGDYYGRGSRLHPKRIWLPGGLEEICQYIPVKKTKHIWGSIDEYGISWCEGTGYLQFGERELRKGRYHWATGWDKDRIWLPRENLPVDCTFHSQPSNDFYSDIPSVEDIFMFLRYRHQRHVVVGRTSYAIFKKTEATLPAIISLYEWEQRNKYQRVRLQKRHPPEPGRKRENGWDIEHRYITIALRNIGLRGPSLWPTKLYLRRKVWLSGINPLGIAVSRLPRQ